MVPRVTHNVANSWLYRCVAGTTPPTAAHGSEKHQVILVNFMPHLQTPRVRPTSLVQVQDHSLFCAMTSHSATELAQCHWLDGTATSAVERLPGHTESI